MRVSQSGNPYHSVPGTNLHIAWRFVLLENLIDIYKKRRNEWVQQIVRPQKEKKEPVFVQKVTMPKSMQD